MCNIVIFPIIFYFFNTSTLIEVQNSSYTKNEIEIFLVKQYWHTAIVIHLEDIDDKKYRFKKFFRNYNLIDFGWGDEMFYQHPDFDLYLGARAILKPTSSTLRVEGINLSKELFFQLSEIVIRLDVTQNQLEKILEFIEKTFYKENDEYVILNVIANKIYFFKSYGYYHLFNTCNTWIAKCLNYAGFNIDTKIILTEQLFREVIKFGELIVNNRN
jgi:uncharacterized protein (TIGR02117 family)